MERIETPFINIRTDFGFKYVFGQPENKPALVRFLNILFEGKLSVRDVVYHDKEKLPGTEDGKRIVYDVYATSTSKRSESSFFPASQTKDAKGDIDSEHHFILEMQNEYVHPFEERLVYYTSKMITEQGRAGWDYTLSPTFTIAVTKFPFSNMNLKRKLKHDVMLLDRESNEPLTDKLHIILLSLEELPERWEECRTELEQVLFLIKNMETMTNTSIAYREGKFPEIFEAAKSQRLSSEQVIEYSKSRARLRDIENSLNWTAEKNREEGIEIGLKRGIQQGVALGAEKERVKHAKWAKTQGKLSLEDISAMTGLSITEIEDL